MENFRKQRIVDALHAYLERTFSKTARWKGFEGWVFSILASCCTSSRVQNSNCTRNLPRNVQSPQSWSGLPPPNRAKETPRRPGQEQVFPLFHYCQMPPPPYWIFLKAHKRIRWIASANYQSIHSQWICITSCRTTSLRHKIQS